MASTVKTSLLLLQWGRGLFASTTHRHLGSSMIITTEHIQALRSVTNGFSKKQIDKMKRLGVKGFKSLVGKDVSEADYQTLLNYRNNKTKKQKPKHLNPMSKDTGSWDWKPQPQDIPAKKYSKSPKQKRKIKVTKQSAKQFYESPEWRSLRYRVSEKHSGECMLCGRSKRKHGVVIHVDHIKPKSKYPELALEYNNLQLLCEDCNLGKSNKYETDYRPEEA